MLLNQILTLQSKYHKELISTDSIFKSSIVQVWWACVNFDTYYTYSYQYYIEIYYVINNCTFVHLFLYLHVSSQAHCTEKMTIATMTSPIDYEVTFWLERESEFIWETDNVAC